MDVGFLSPGGSLAALAVCVPLAALAWVEHRAGSVRAALGLERPGRSPLAVPLALAAVAGLLALACAQPVAARKTTRPERSDVQVFLLVDVSRSMLAGTRPGGATRFDRAVRIATSLRASVPDVPVGLASLTDRALPHVFPTTDDDAFTSTLHRALGVSRPPPQRVATRATALVVLGSLATTNFYDEDVHRRVAVVLTDGETLPVNAQQLVGVLADAEPVRFAFVRLGSTRERIFLPSGKPELAYRADPNAGASLRTLAKAIGAVSFDEGDARGATRWLRDAVGTGPTQGETARERTVPLAPFAVFAALLPLGIIVRLRHRA
jgi:hypothetical protein